LENVEELKQEKEDLILEKSQIESKYKALKAEFGSLKKGLENKNVLIKNKDQNIAKLSEENKYLAYNYKSAKVDLDKSYQDIIAYQQILRKMEKDIEDLQNNNTVNDINYRFGNNNLQYNKNK